jgi:Ca2+-transporting ATPase
MITGDHPGTALEIARQAGLPAESALTGAEIAAMGDAALARAVERCSVFARVRPEQKLRLVAAYKAAGEVVAMTGDGVNDAPALKSAHIGIAMGSRGTDVAREAAALVLLEDDFAAIVHTVRLGRRIYENIRNAMRYLIAVHVPTAGLSLVPLALGWPLALFPVHIVFLEFVIDPACSTVFEAEASDEEAMRRPPRPPAAPLFDGRMLALSLAVGATLLAAVLALYGWALASGRGDEQARALAFVAIVAGNLALIFVNRSRSRTALAMLGSPNTMLWAIATATLGALAVALYAPPLAALFRFAAPAPADLALALGAGIASVGWIELLKRPWRGGVSAAGSAG